MPEEPPLLLVDCDAESAQTSTRNVRQIEARLITVDLAALERELAAA